MAFWDWGFRSFFEQKILLGENFEFCIKIFVRKIFMFYRIFMILFKNVIFKKSSFLNVFKNIQYQIQILTSFQTPPTPSLALVLHIQDKKHGSSRRSYSNNRRTLWYFMLLHFIIEIAWSETMLSCTIKHEMKCFLLT